MGIASNYIYKSCRDIVFNAFVNDFKKERELMFYVQFHMLNTHNKKILFILDYTAQLPELALCSFY